MELYYAQEIGASQAVLTPEDSLHCVKVLRHKKGDVIHVMDGEGTMFDCRIVSDRYNEVVAVIEQSHQEWNAHGYRLTMGVCPTKNADRFEWFVEKATEIGVDVIVPMSGDRSERRDYRLRRANKLAISAAKQSLKARLPLVEPLVSVRDFVARPNGGGKYIACCFETPAYPRRSLVEALRANGEKDVTVLIGPEGDFSPEEVSLALSQGYVPVHLGNSRLRTETAALVAVTMVYSHFLK